MDGRLRSIAGCTPSRPASPGRKSADRLEPVKELLHQLREVSITADEMLGRYYALTYDRCGGNCQAAGRRLGVELRVVRDRLDRTFLDKLRRVEM